MNCACHGEPMRWHKDPRQASGGYWRCRIKHRAVARAWQAAYRLNHPDKIARSNARRMYVGSMYVGCVGFTDSEVKEMISGSSD